MQDLAESFVLFLFFLRLWHCMFMGLSWRDALWEGKLKEGLQVALSVFVVFGNSASQVLSFLVSVFVVLSRCLGSSICLVSQDG